MAGPRKLLNSLKEGDPQAVAVVAILLFLASVAWFVWSTRLVPGDVEVPSGTSRPRPPSPTPTPFSAYIEAEQAFRTGEKPANPFHLPWQARPQAQATPQGGNNTAQPPPPANTPRPTPVPAPTPVPSVTYLFKGTLTRPDGVRIALVSEPKTGQSHFLASGDSLGPYTVADLNADQILLGLGGDSPVPLRRGEPQTFEQRP